MQALLQMRLEQTPQQTWSYHELSRDRDITRVVRVYRCCGQFDAEWTGLRAAICLEQTGTRSGKPYHQRRWFMSSLITSAGGFAQLIRNHWQIENPLHWVKDVVLHEDRPCVTPMLL